ncbi:MAG: hypothetical protein ACREBV_08600, partial [Candidatus Zixiibacteriota bacterium]
MRFSGLLAISLLGLNSGDVSGKDIYSLIVGGEIEEAQELLSQASTAHQRDGNHLFFLSLLESDAG